MTDVFLTGFPGFLGSALVPRLLERYPQEVSINCLIQAKFRQQAQAKLEEIEQQKPEWKGRIHLEEGDITRPDLGLGDRLQTLQQGTVEIFHLAAVYDLGVKRDLAMRVNVDGTRYMLDFAKGCPNLHRFQYVSTCYVSGKYEGIFTECDLEKGQQFNNYYEETKYLAEVDVQREMRNGLPVTIYRPAIVQGDSHTGATQKYDGPYYVMQWILRQPRFAVVPVLGNPEKYEINVVPRDFVIEAITYLSGTEISKNKVYQLSDPNPPTVGQMMKIMGQATAHKLIKIPLPPSLAKWSMKKVPGLQKFMRVEPETLSYMIHPTQYRCEQTSEDLKGSGIFCPAYANYADRLVSFMRQNPHISAAAMV